jgi:fructose-bisphosphate aldolase class I
MQHASGKYKEELIKTASEIAAPGKGILAADESTGTIGNRFKNINVENTHENRVAYRQLLFTTEGLEKHISGVIMFDETVRDSGSDGKRFMETLRGKGIHCGIKVDTGSVPISGTNNETATQGLDGLGKRCAEYYGMGCRFAKWRAIVKIGNGCPSDLAIQETAHSLARYGSICQENGLVPIIEPEILLDGDHDIDVCAAVSERVFSAVMKELFNQNLLIEGLLLKPNMVTPGADCVKRATADEIAWYTVRTLSRTIVPALPGVTFLSGGQSEEDASLNLNAMNKIKGLPHPWALTFSYGRALQTSVLKAWGG